ncbi:MAG: methylated-DNA-[protein]-cysteine S-methyltransferase [Methylobacteriaceae bacterium]|jgi:methylated-DNA-[protein]-cysteine S-methyltransferase|nr:methylated-DNA-[protein]-cysteine S-methyltransferase [Methylobacteriaceae bacterium]
MNASFTLFETAIGPCALIWGEHGIFGVQLPERNAAATRARIIRRFPDAEEGAPAGDVAGARDAIVALICGENRDLRDVALDMRDLPSLNRQVYEIARAIAPGATLTYGDIAIKLGDRTLAQAVGQALGKNPYPIIVPCHRVLASGGKIGGFSAPTGIALKRKLLAIESVHARGAPSLFDSLRQAS